MINNEFLDRFPSFSEFNRQLISFASDNPGSQWHLGASNKRIYVTLQELARHFSVGCNIVDMGCLPPNIPVGMKVLGLWDKCQYLGICSEKPDSNVFKDACKSVLQMKMEAVNLDPNFHMFQNVSALPVKCSLPDGSVDIVIATEVLEHMVWPHSLLQEAYRLLKPGGILIASTPNATNAGVVMKCLLGRGAFENYCDSHLTSKDWMKHVRFYSFSEMRLLLSENGLMMASRHYLCNTGVYSESKGFHSHIKRVLRTSMYIIPWWREGIFFTAVKK
ncbi:MAG: class I SAM-dependent methyltransferase [Phycisphaerae bacterium]|nr:class I SAM-dependent methyltransferase [Phycisphaerae bacterium]